LISDVDGLNHLPGAGTPVACRKTLDLIPIPSNPTWPNPAFPGLPIGAHPADVSPEKRRQFCLFVHLFSKCVLMSQF